MIDISELQSLHDEERRQAIARKALYKAINRMGHKPSEEQMHILLEMTMDAASAAWTAALDREK